MALGRAKPCPPRGGTPNSGGEFVFDKQEVSCERNREAARIRVSPKNPEVCSADETGSKKVERKRSQASFGGREWEQAVAEGWMGEWSRLRISRHGSGAGGRARP